MNDWEQHKLIDVADVKLSNVDKKTKPDERTIKLCNYTDVYKNSFINSDKAEGFMIASCNENEYEKFILRKGQVAITKDSEKRDDIGIPTYIAEDFDDVVLGYHLSLITPDDKKLDGRFLNYWLNTKHAKRYFENNAGGSGQRCTLILDTIKSIPLHLPKLQVQKQIAKVLSDLDAKIELNNKINQELEAMAKTIYDYWFVQFDFPDANAKPYKASGGKMVYNEVLKREIPEGWEDGSFETIANIIGGSTPSKAIEDNFTNEEATPWITPKDLSLNKGNKYITRGQWDVTENGIKSASLRVMPKNTVLLSSRAPIGYLAISREEATTNQGFKSFVPKRNYPSEFVFYCVKNQIPTIEAYSSGSTFKEVSASTLKSISICIPSEKVLSAYKKIAKPIFSKQNYLELENQKLAALRDWLLPMLMNGQVRVAHSLEKGNLNNEILKRVQDDNLGMVAEEGETYNKSSDLKMVVVKPVSKDAPIIATHIVSKLANSNGMGKTKFQKVLHLGQYYCEKDLGGLYKKNVAGPHNDILLREIEGKFKNFNHIKITTDIVNGKKHFNYQTTSRTKESEDIYNEFSESFKSKLDYLIDVLKPLSLKQTEAISTLYAVWNNRLIESLEVNFKLLKQDFFNWSKRKREEFIDKDISDAYDTMKLHNIIPSGWGEYIE